MAKKILVLSPSWIGDCVMTQPMLRRLSELHPDCVIDVFAPKWSQAWGGCWASAVTTK